MRLSVALLCLFFWVGSLLAQQPSPSPELLRLNQEYTAKYQAGQLPEALTLIDKMLASPDLASLPNARPGLLFNRACLQSLLGEKTQAIASLRLALDAGYTRYSSYATDSDLDPLRTDPEFKTLIAEIKEKWGPKALEWDASEPGFEFRLQFDSPDIHDLALLRTEFSVDPVVAGAGDDYEKLIRLTKWTSEQWQHDSSHMASKNDPLTILREAKAGGRFICQNYAVVAAGVTRAYGLYSRLLGLLPKDVETRSEAHSVAEVWLPKFKKWVIADGQYGIVPEFRGIPLSGLELQRAIAEEAPIECRGNSAKCADWKNFIMPNIFYFKIAQNQHRFGMKTGTAQLVLVPKGAAKPRKFAGGNEEVFAGSIYTSNPATFYAPPE
ncbi:MAG: hypothetical protein EHM61_02020 [Acidobacteria bacterium]|nr:MAG: hypothetical protein EHM61_02020 [Acidobacteriota bacterium]